MKLSSLRILCQSVAASAVQSLPSFHFPASHVCMVFCFASITRTVRNPKMTAMSVLKSSTAARRYINDELGDIITLLANSRSIRTTIATMTATQKNGKSSAGFLEASEVSVNIGQNDGSPEWHIVKCFTSASVDARFFLEFQGRIHLANNTGNLDNRVLLLFFTLIFWRDAGLISSALLLGHVMWLD